MTHVSNFVLLKKPSTLINMAPKQLNGSKIHLHKNLLRDCQMGAHLYFYGESLERIDMWTSFFLYWKTSENKRARWSCIHRKLVQMFNYCTVVLGMQNIFKADPGIFIQ